MMHKINTPFSIAFPSDAALPLATGLVLGDFDVSLFLDGAPYAPVISFTEIGSGYYQLSFTPDQTGRMNLFVSRLLTGAFVAKETVQFSLQDIDDVAQMVPLGDHPIQVLVQDASAVPVPNAWIHVWNAAKTIRLALVRADNSGEATLLLSDGTYAIFVQHPFGIQALSDETLVVSGPSNEVYTLSSFSLLAPPSGHLCRVYGSLADPRGAPLRGVEAICYRESPHLAQDLLIGGKVLKTQTNASGFFSFDLLRGAKVRLVIDQASWSKTFTVPDQASIAYKDIVDP